MFKKLYFAVRKNVYTYEKKKQNLPTKKIPDPYH